MKSAQLFSGRSAVVTGAASGIGYALCECLVEAGARVYGVDRNEQGLQALAQSYGTAFVPVVLDITSEEGVKQLLERVVAEHGRLDYVFNNAGITIGGDFEHMDQAGWQNIMNINLWGVIYGTQHGYNIMVRQKHGHIINTSSTAGLVPVVREIAYTTTKHAIVGLSLSLREEGRKHNVRVSVIAPGMVDTNIFSSAVKIGEHDYMRIVNNHPFPKITPRQAATIILEGVQRNKALIIFPRYNRVIIRLYRWFPTLMSRVINDFKGQGD